MIKSELVQRIATANPHLYHRDVERIVNVIFDEIVDALSRGDRVELAASAPSPSSIAHRGKGETPAPERPFLLLRNLCRSSRPAKSFATV